jgi:hypothetical protein
VSSAMSTVFAAPAAGLIVSCIGGAERKR